MVRALMPPPAAAIADRKPIAWLVACAAATLALAPTAAAREYVVTKRGDHPPDSGPGHCTLREAVLDANDSLGEADTVVLPRRRWPYNLRLANTTPFEDGARTGDLDVTNDPLRVVHRGRGRATIDANGGSTASSRHSPAPISPSSASG